ncbi:MAG: hypothetical protein V1874_01490 [Spirochaetota bacterium]
MCSVKKFWKSFAILAILLFIPASGYAIIDASVFGGRSFGGEIESSGSKTDIDGWQYGCYGHVNTGIPFILTAGAGGFYLIAPLKGDVDAKKKTAGLDVYAQIDLPILPVFPYARYGIALNEKVEVKTSGGSSNISENFKSHYFGFGLSRTLFSLVKLKVMIFAEYLYTTSKQENDVKIKGNAVNVGVTASL